MSSAARTVIAPRLTSAGRKAASLPNDVLRNVGGTSALSPSSVSRLPEKQRPRCLLIQVPDTVLPNDVLRALREIEAVDSDFSVSSLTPYPIGAIRRASLNTQYHITARTPDAARQMHQLISTRPLFPASFPRVGPAHARPALSEDGVREGSTVGFCVLDARAWAAALIHRAEVRAKVRGGYPWDEINVDWALDPALSGRRVLLRGLPGKETKSGVHNLVYEYVDEGNDAIVRLPPQPWSNISCWVITCPTVALAYDLAAKFHMNFFLNTQYGSKFPMRAHVVW